MSDGKHSATIALGLILFSIFGALCIRIELGARPDCDALICDAMTLWCCDAVTLDRDGGFPAAIMQPRRFTRINRKRLRLDNLAISYVEDSMCTR